MRLPRAARGQGAICRQSQPPFGCSRQFSSPDQSYGRLVSVLTGVIRSVDGSKARGHGWCGAYGQFPSRLSTAGSQRHHRGKCDVPHPPPRTPAPFPRLPAYPGMSANDPPGLSAADLESLAASPTGRWRRRHAPASRGVPQRAHGPAVLGAVASVRRHPPIPAMPCDSLAGTRGPGGLTGPAQTQSASRLATAARAAPPQQPPPPGHGVCG